MKILDYLRRELTAKFPGGRKSSHNRYHRDRGIVKPDCSLCRGDISL